MLNKLQVFFFASSMPFVSLQDTSDNYQPFCQSLDTIETLTETVMRQNVIYIGRVKGEVDEKSVDIGHNRIAGSARIIPTKVIYGELSESEILIPAYRYNETIWATLSELFTNIRLSELAIASVSTNGNVPMYLGKFEGNCQFIPLLQPEQEYLIMPKRPFTGWSIVLLSGENHMSVEKTIKRIIGSSNAIN